MEKVVVLTGVETKASGTNENGPWSINVFTDAGGNKFTVKFDEELKTRCFQLMNQPVRITWVEEPRKYVYQGKEGTTVDLAVTSIEAAPGQQPDNQKISKSSAGASSNGGGGGGGRSSDPLRDARIASQWALNAAHETIQGAVKSGVAQPIADPDVYVLACENLAAKFLEASSRLVQKISGVSGGGPSSQPQSGATAGGDPAAAAGGNAWTGQQY